MIKKLPYKIIDLTHKLSPDNPTWDGSCGFEHQTTLDYNDCKTEVKFHVQQIKMHAGIGTHIDAPSHCIPQGKSVADLDLNDLISPCVMIDVSKKAGEGYSVSANDLKEFEEKHGTISEGSFVIVYTGWDQFWDNPQKYRCNYRYPSLTEEFAKHLLERNVTGIGMDTLSPDRPEDDFPVHRIILGAGKYIVENIAHAKQLPPVSAFSLVMPIKIAGGTEAPIRLVALVKE
jgi:kynurenine formamidase